MTEQMSDLISFQMCMARKSQRRADYTPDTLTFKSGDTTPHLKRLREKEASIVRCFLGLWRHLLGDTTPSIIRW